MDKQDIIREYNKFIEKFKLKPTECGVGAGAALVMYGLRDTTNDIDADLPEERFNLFLVTKRYKTSEFRGNLVIHYNQHIDLHLRKPGLSYQLVDGIYCYTPETLLQQKLELNRPKDQEDIKKLKEYIKNHK